MGGVDIVCANAGTWTYGKVHELADEEWSDTIDILLTGVWNTCRATVPHLIAQGRGGAVVLTSSLVGLRGVPNLGHYVAAKHAVIGLMKTLAIELAPHLIRVNAINPGTVDTDLVHNRATYELFAPDIVDPTREQVIERFQSLSVMPVPWVEVRDVSNGLLFLVSDEARYITGISLPIDAGASIR